MENKIDYYEEDGKLKYNYSLKNNEGYIYIWQETDLSKYSSLKFSKHAEEKLFERGINKKDIENFFTNARFKVAWIPDYNSDIGSSVRVIGKHPDKNINFISIITSIDLDDDNRLEILTAYRIHKNKKDYRIWELGHERLAQLEEKNLIPDEDLIINNIPKTSSSTNRPVKNSYNSTKPQTQPNQHHPTL